MQGGDIDFEPWPLGTPCCGGCVTQDPDTLLAHALPAQQESVVLGMPPAKRQVIIESLVVATWRYRVSTVSAILSRAVLLLHCLAVRIWHW